MSPTRPCLRVFAGLLQPRGTGAGLRWLPLAAFMNINESAFKKNFACRLYILWSLYAICIIVRSSVYRIHSFVICIRTNDRAYVALNFTSTIIRYTWRWISRKPLETKVIWFQRTTGPSIGNGVWAIRWSRDRWRHVILKGQTSDPSTLRAQYLVNSWRCYLTTIAV